MALYEHIFLARQDVSSQQVDQLVEQYKGVLEEHGGSVGKVENWGLKTLTYRIRKNRKAYYTLMNVDAPPAAVHEMERQMRFNEDILRTLTVRVGKLDDAPSPMMQKRDDRGRRGERGPRRGGREGGGGREGREGGGRGDGVPHQPAASPQTPNPAE